MKPSLDKYYGKQGSICRPESWCRAFLRNQITTNLYNERLNREAKKIIKPNSPLDKTIVALRTLQKVRYEFKSIHRSEDNTGAFKKSAAQKGFEFYHYGDENEEKKENYNITTDLKEGKTVFIVEKKDSTEPPYMVEVVPDNTMRCELGLAISEDAR